MSRWPAILLILMTVFTVGFTAFAGDDEIEHIDVNDLRPTQFAVGMNYVREKAKKIESFDSKEERHDYLKEHPIPVIIGYDGEYYMIDHHHLARAVYEAGYHRVYIQVVADWSDLDLTKKEFWKRMKQKGYVYLYDKNDHLRSVSELPESIDELKDDPYRALAGEVRDEGGYKKTKTPFSEFQWARFFRERIRLSYIKKSWSKSVATGLSLAKSPEASALPGYKGPMTCPMLFQ